MDIYRKLFKSYPTPALLFQKKQGNFILQDFSRSYINEISQGREARVSEDLREAMKNLAINEPDISLV